MKKRTDLFHFFSLFFSFLFFFSIITAQASESQSSPFTSIPKYRSLFVTSDIYLSEENTWPSFINSAKTVASALEGSDFNFVSPPSQKIYSSTIGSLKGLKKAIRKAFLPANHNDVSFFYISVHGLEAPKDQNSSSYLLLSDGTKEEAVYPKDLENAFQGIKGIKVLLIDACHSGNFIGKGGSLGETALTFTDPSFKVLVSAGGNEKSWIHGKKRHSSQLATLNYFSSSIAEAFGFFGFPKADINRNGKITLNELHQYLLNTHILSTAYVYPENDEFVVFSYNPASFATISYHESKPVVDVEMTSNVLSSTNPTVTFSFTLVEKTKIAYQLIYYKNKAWQLDRPPDIIYEQNDTDEEGFLLRGRKTRTLTFTPPEAAHTFSYGYAMLQIVAIIDNEPIVQASRLLTIVPDMADPNLFIYSGPSFIPEKFIEFPIYVRHSYPCRLSVYVVNDQGKIVRHLAEKKASRPNNRNPLGTDFYWDGADNQGIFLPQGAYQITAKAYLGSHEFTYTSSPLLLIRESEG